MPCLVFRAPSYLFPGESPFKAIGVARLGRGGLGLTAGRGSACLCMVHRTNRMRIRRECHKFLWCRGGRKGACNVAVQFVIEARVGLFSALGGEVCPRAQIRLGSRISSSSAARCGQTLILGYQLSVTGAWLCSLVFQRCKLGGARWV